MSKLERKANLVAIVSLLCIFASSSALGNQSWTCQEINVGGGTIDPETGKRRKPIQVGKPRKQKQCEPCYGGWKAIKVTPNDKACRTPDFRPFGECTGLADLRDHLGWRKDSKFHVCKINGYGAYFGYKDFYSHGGVCYNGVEADCRDSHNFNLNPGSRIQRFKNLGFPSAYFEKDSARLIQSFERDLEAAVQRYRDDKWSNSDYFVKLTIVGDADCWGDQQDNKVLALQRARAVYRKLLTLEVQPPGISIRYSDAISGRSPGTCEEDEAEQRRAYFEVSNF